MFERLFIRANSWAVILLLAAMACIVFCNVTLRYLTNYSIVWAEEVARYMMVWLAFIGAGLALRQGLHVAVGNLHHILPRTGARILRLAIVILLLGFSLVMVWQGWEYLTRMGRQLTPATRISFAYIYAAMPVGFALFAIHLSLIARHYLTEGNLEAPFSEGETPAADRGAIS
ncbi:TRAP transporter small permease [Rhodospirillum sp. A1_3_36]|uniref:TRAP transporter small permease n=1 Tax=Rhodospirillum sp. A1_3_36 TaxID=3391666 RepID=UPI0039A4F3FC